MCCLSTYCVFLPWSQCMSVASTWRSVLNCPTEPYFLLYTSWHSLPGNMYRKSQSLPGAITDCKDFWCFDSKDGPYHEKEKKNERSWSWIRCYPEGKGMGKASETGWLGRDLMYHSWQGVGHDPSRLIAFVFISLRFPLVLTLIAILLLFILPFLFCTEEFV